MALRNLLVRVGADISELQKGMRQAQASLQKFSKSIQSTLGIAQGQIAGLVAGIGGALMMKEGIEDAIKYEALMGTLGESMGESRKQFEEWQETVGSAMGFSKLEGAELANTLSLNFKKIAKSHEELVDKTTKMMEVAAVISNKRGMLMSEVSDRIRSAMNQEADGSFIIAV